MVYIKIIKLFACSGRCNNWEQNANNESIDFIEKGKSKDKNKDSGDQRMLLSTRFPQEQWTAAQEYFKVS